MILPGVDAKTYHEMSRDERAEAFAGAAERVKQGAADIMDDLRRPISFKGCIRSVAMAVVQHAASANTITVSHDGKIEGAWRLPLTYAKAPKAGQPIVRILHTEIAFQPMPLEFGFLLIEVPGWLASKEELCQARSPQLSAETEWTEPQRAAWDRLRKSLFAVREAPARAEGQKRKQARYADYRARRNADGFYTVSELAFGKARL